MRANVPQRCAWQTDFFIIIFLMKNSGCRRSMQNYILTHSRLSRRGNLSELLSIRKGPGLNFRYHSTTSRAGSGARVSGGGPRWGVGCVRRVFGSLPRRRYTGAHCYLYSAFRLSAWCEEIAGARATFKRNKSPEPTCCLVPVEISFEVPRSSVQTLARVIGLSLIHI